MVQKLMNWIETKGKPAVDKLKQLEAKNEEDNDELLRISNL